MPVQSPVLAVKLVVITGLTLFVQLASLRSQIVDFGITPDSDTVEDHFNSGEYEQALEKAKAGGKMNPRDPLFWRIEAQSLFALGRYEDAYTSLSESLSRNFSSIRMRLLARKAGLYTNRADFAVEQLYSIDRLLGRRWRTNSSLDEIVALGEATLLFGIEPRLVLENFFKGAREDTDPPPSAFLASGQLALDKHDAKLASRMFQDGLALFPDNPDLWHRLALSFMDSDRTQLVTNIERALALNPRHLPSLVLLAEHLIDAESFADAHEQLDRALDTNPQYPDALALKSVLAYFDNEPQQAEEFRREALSTWSSNPNVHHLIGKKLSQKYWFKEGASSQRRALSADEGHTSARIQLAQDLLRLGQEEEGWEHANRAHEEDPYDIAAYNLVSLQDKLDEFVTLKTENFHLRMSKREAPIYGARSLKLLEDAYQELSTKYAITLDEPVTVEIYPNPNDFAVRTFGMPGNPGYLGVCFGPVFTINSPASQRANWEAVLYHEFCHVITLSMTNNKMPRWLSEGISVYEERLKDGSWGQMMNLDYRNRILEGRMQPISGMSAAFLQAQSGEDTQFAYYQSSLVVRFLFETYGLESIRSILRSLGEGIHMNESLDQHLAPLAELDAAFETFAQAEANAFGGDYDLTPPNPSLLSNIPSLTLRKNYFEQQESATELIANEQWEDARILLEELVDKGGYIPEESNSHILLAKIYEQLGETDLEKATLTTIAESESDRLDAITRLLVIARLNQNWTELKRWSNAWLAINPMAMTPARALLDAEENLQNTTEAIDAGKILIELAPTDVATIHYRIAKQLQFDDITAARRHTLMALEAAPRFRSAYQFLNTLGKTPPPSEQSTSPPESIDRASSSDIKTQLEQFLEDQ